MGIKTLKKDYDDVLTPFLIEITKLGLCCNRCNHRWIPKYKNKLPKFCPHCQSPYFNKPRQKPKVINSRKR
jgi:hypothetical protein